MKEDQRRSEKTIEELTNERDIHKVQDKVKYQKWMKERVPSNKSNGCE